MKATRVLSIPSGQAPDVMRRIAAHTVEAGGCWRWTGGLDRHGYGRFRLRVDGSPKDTGSHRAAWLAYRGDIPEALQIDHLCRSRACVNPWHMELVTNAVNTKRSDHTNKKGRSGRKPAGVLHSCGTHGREDGYLWHPRDGYTRWVCRICRRATSQRWRSRRDSAPSL